MRTAVYGALAMITVAVAALAVYLHREKAAEDDARAINRMVNIGMTPDDVARRLGDPIAPSSTNAHGHRIETHQVKGRTVTVEYVKDRLSVLLVQGWD